MQHGSVQGLLCALEGIFWNDDDIMMSRLPLRAARDFFACAQITPGARRAFQKFRPPDSRLQTFRGGAWLPGCQIRTFSVAMANRAVES